MSSALPTPAAPPRRARPLTHAIQTALLCSALAHQNASAQVAAETQSAPGGVAQMPAVTVTGASLWHHRRHEFLHHRIHEHRHGPHAGAARNAAIGQRGDTPADRGPGPARHRRDPRVGARHLGNAQRQQPLFVLGARFSIDNFQFDGLSTPILSLWNYGTTDIDAAIYDRVEVVRGATGLMNGSGNPSAAVNFVRKRPLRDFAASASVGAGSWDKIRGEADLSVPLTENGKIRSRVVAAYSQGNSNVTFLDARSRTFYGVVSADLTPDTVLTASVEYQRNISHGFGSGFPLFYSDGSRTDFNRSVANNTPWARQDTESTTYFVDLTHRFANDWKLRAAYSHSDGKYRMKQLFRAATRTARDRPGHDQQLRQLRRPARPRRHPPVAERPVHAVRPAPRDRRRLDEH